MKAESERETQVYTLEIMDYLVKRVDTKDADRTRKADIDETDYKS